VTTRVLVADDSAVVRAVVRQTLEAEGYAVAEATDGEQAIERCRSDAPDLLLLDIRMPHTDGFEVLTALRADPDLAALPVVCLTALSSGDGVAEALKLGADDYLRKPFEAVELLARVRSALHRRQRGGVLVVDDNPINQAVAARMLVKRGFRVDLASDGHEAVRATLAGSYDLVLMDCEMPGLDGFEATGLIRAAERPGERTRIVAMTAHATAEARERCVAHGMDGYVTKPLRGAALDALVGGEDLIDAALVSELREEFAGANARDQLVDLIESFIGNAGAGVAALRTAAAAGDHEAVRAAAHRLKGAAANLGAARLRAQAAAIEDAPAGADPDALAAALAATGPALRAAVAA
jgi:two-component system sensor histidine kinase/response regulator